MKVDYISDVHVDFWCRDQNPESPKFKKQIDTLINTICPNKHDVLLIAGDLGHYNQQDQAVLLALKEYYKHIMLVRGNHDMYLVSGSMQKKYLYDSKNRYLEMKMWCKEQDGIHYLDGDIISIDGVTFGGVGMSWDKSYYDYLNRDDGHIASKGEIREFFNNYMNDSRLILGGNPNVEVPTGYGDTYVKSSFDYEAYLQSEKQKLENIRDYDNIDIMVSHYTPVIPENYESTTYGLSSSSTFYMFNGYKDVERINPKYWIFGHMHSNHDFMYNDTRFLCNPLGYPGENSYNVIKTILI